ncbi:hypothetical protein BJ912DRAFT_931169 [Pholiota molesta]|nr:hypothetical protein BJ912DRAFT_931169 [Pholiota molesta]
MAEGQHGAAIAGDRRRRHVAEGRQGQRGGECGGERGVNGGDHETDGARGRTGAIAVAGSSSSWRVTWHGGHRRRVVAIRGDRGGRWWSGRWSFSPRVTRRRWCWWWPSIEVPRERDVGAVALVVGVVVACRRVMWDRGWPSSSLTGVVGVTGGQCGGWWVPSSCAGVAGHARWWWTTAVVAGRGDVVCCGRRRRLRAAGMDDVAAVAAVVGVVVCGCHGRETWWVVGGVVVASRASRARNGAAVEGVVVCGCRRTTQRACDVALVACGRRRRVRVRVCGERWGWRGGEPGQRGLNDGMGGRGLPFVATSHSGGRRVRSAAIAWAVVFVVVATSHGGGRRVRSAAIAWAVGWSRSSAGGGGMWWDVGGDRWRSRWVVVVVVATSHGARRGGGRRASSADMRAGVRWEIGIGGESLVSAG